MRFKAAFYFFLICSLLTAGPHRRRFKVGNDDANLERILTIEDQRLAKEAFLVQALKHPSQRVLSAALTAMGRIGDPSALDEVAKLLSHRNREIKKLAAFALGLIGGETSYKILTQNLQMQKDPEILGALLIAIGRSGNERALEPLEKTIRDRLEPRLLELACQGLGILWSGNSEKWTVSSPLLARLAKLAQESDPVATTAAFALARYKGSANALPASEIQESVIKTRSPFARALLSRVLGRIKSKSSSETLVRVYKDGASLGTRIEVIKALSQQDYSDAIRGVLRAGLSDSNSGVVFQTLETLSSHGEKASALSDPVEAIFKSSRSTWLRGNALKALVKTNPRVGKAKMLEVFNIPSSPLLPYAVKSLGLLGGSLEIERLATYLSDKDLKTTEEAVEAVGNLSPEKVSIGIRTALRKIVDRGDIGLTCLVAELVQQMKWKEFGPLLAGTYGRFTNSDLVEARVAIITTIGVLGDVSSMPIVQAALDDPNRLVVEAAVKTLKGLTGKDESGRIPLNNKIKDVVPSLADLRLAMFQRVLLKTNRGTIRLRMLRDAPVSAFHFTQLVRSGFYNGKTFHRVVPDFVLQGGDPRGDGYGGPGFLIRDEVSQVKHLRGVVGIATAGKDSGGCQFFINLAPNLHLDGRYTVFAEVVTGMEVAEKIEMGDTILAARVY